MSFREKWAIENISDPAGPQVSAQLFPYNPAKQQQISANDGSGDLVFGGKWRCCQTNANSSPFPYPRSTSGREKAAPLGESGGAAELVVIAVLEMALRREVVVH